MMRKYPAQTLPITAVQVAGVGLLSFVWMCAEAWQSGHLDASLLAPVLADTKVLGSILYLGVVTTALTRIGETTALGSVSSGDASILFTTEPLWAAVFGSLLMGENLGVSAWIGGGLIVAGVCACLAAQHLVGRPAVSRPVCVHVGGCVVCAPAVRQRKSMLLDALLGRSSRVLLFVRGRVWSASCCRRECVIAKHAAAIGMLCHMHVEGTCVN